MQQIANYAHDTGENILWHPQENALYWLDIPAGKLFRGHFGGDNSQALHSFCSRCILHLDQAIGGFVLGRLQEDGSTPFLLFASKGRIYSWDYRAPDHPENPENPDNPENQVPPQLYAQLAEELVPSRFNDVFALPAFPGKSLGGGQAVLCTTMPSEGQTDSRLLRFDLATRQAEVVQANLKLGNGMGLSPDRRYLYFADTRDFAVYRFAVRSTGQIDWASRSKWIDFHGRPGRPDGLCVDSAGRIWLAETGAGCVSCFAPDGRELGTLAVGTPKVTCCCLGSSSRQILFVSTQGGQGGQAGQNPDQKAGGIFALDLQALRTLPDWQAKGAWQTAIDLPPRGQDEYLKI